MENNIEKNTGNEFGFRELEADDLFIVSDMMAKIGLENIMESFSASEIKKMLGDKDDVEQIGLSVFVKIGQVVLKNLSLCKEDVYRLLSALTGKTVAEIRKIGAIQFTKMVIAVTKMEVFRDFIKVVSESYR